MWLGTLDSDNIVIILDFCESGSFSSKVTNTGGIIITAGIAQEKCWQEKAYGHGVFSYYFTKAIGNPIIVDQNHNHQVSIEELFEYTSIEVASEFQSFPPPSPQHPYMRDNYFGELTIITYLPGQK
jgi:hypothetical protein